MSQGYTISQLSVGMQASFRKQVTDADIVKFADVSGDTNPVHLDEEFAKTTRFGGRIAHGMLSAGHISAVLANQLPGPGTIYLGQTLAFKAPVKPGDLVETTVEVKSIEKRRVTLITTSRVGDTVVIEGEALVMAPA